MTTQPAPAPYNHILPDVLSPQDVAYLNRLDRALRCGVPGCECATGSTLHCPSHGHAEAPTLTVVWDERREILAFHCPSCPPPRIYDALAKRGLAPASEIYNAFGAQGAGLQPFYFFIQQPPDWLWPNRIPLGKLTLIAGYPSSGKTSIALDIAARVSRGAAAPDQPDALFPSAPVVLALLDDNPKADVLPTLRLFGADLQRVYLADLLSPTHPVDYYPDDPPNDEDDGYFYQEDDDEDEDDEEYVFDNDGNEVRVPRRKPVGIRAPARDPFWSSPAPGSRLVAPWPSLDKVMARLANYIAEGKAVLLIVDQVEDLASMHRARLSTILGMLKALAARTGAAVVALTHNPALNYPRAVTAMQNRLAQASVVFTTAVVGPGERRFLVPLRPAMSDDTPAIPFVLPPSDAFTVAWRKPVFPAHMNALAGPRPDDGARTRAAQTFLTRALADGPRPASEIEREAAMHGISRRTLFRARALAGIRSTRIGASEGPGAGAWYWSLPSRSTPQQDETPR
ncbi:MAG: AAA family ATPase [Chloroflexota bacterium]|nr:AAA family ATPase [Chloroflexota bacterium]MDE2886038.1 AAA family ATPase [Chloroflexota bacterium]